MSKKLAPLTLSGTDEQHRIVFSTIRYLGNGTYICMIDVKSNGFCCEKEFSFDNDEYFITKLKEVLANQVGEAELMGLQSDSYLKLQAFGPGTLLISGLIIEEQPLTQTLEFAFTTQYELIDKFVTKFATMVHANT